MYKRFQRPSLPPLPSAARCPPHSTAVIVLVVVASSMLGCRGDNSAGQDTGLAEELTRQLQDERLRHQRDDARHNAEFVGADGDYLGAVLGWASTTLAVVILILLLARERTARRVIERMLRLAFDRLRESRGPPYS